MVDMSILFFIREFGKDSRVHEFNDLHHLHSLFTRL